MKFQTSDQMPVNNNSFDAEKIDAVIGRTYDTRGIKHNYEEGPISILPSRNIYRQNKI